MKQLHQSILCICTKLNLHVVVSCMPAKLILVIIIQTVFVMFFGQQKCLCLGLNISGKHWLRQGIFLGEASACLKC